MSCGARPTGHKKFCRQCGVGLNPEQVVCVKCGAKIDTFGGFQSLFNTAAEGLQSLGKSVNQSTGSSSNTITIGEKLIFATIVLALISVTLPWIYIHLPMGGTVSAPVPRIYWFLGSAFLSWNCIFLSWMDGSKKTENKFSQNNRLCMCGDRSISYTDIGLGICSLHTAA